MKIMIQVRFYITTSQWRSWRAQYLLQTTMLVKYVTAPPTSRLRVDSDLKVTHCGVYVCSLSLSCGSFVWHHSRQCTYIATVRCNTLSMLFVHSCVSVISCDPCILLMFQFISCTFYVLYLLCRIDCKLLAVYSLVSSSVQKWS